MTATVELVLDQGLAPEDSRWIAADASGPRLACSVEACGARRRPGRVGASSARPRWGGAPANSPRSASTTRYAPAGGRTTGELIRLRAGRVRTRPAEGVRVAVRHGGSRHASVGRTAARALGAPPRRRSCTCAAPERSCPRARRVRVRAALERCCPFARPRCRWSMPCCRFAGASGTDAFFATLESALAHGMLTSARLADLRARITESARWLVDLARYRCRERAGVAAPTSPPPPGSRSRRRSRSRASVGWTSCSVIGSSSRSTVETEP